MTELISGYIYGCTLVEERIAALNKQLHELRNNTGSSPQSVRDLEKRLSVLYTEHRQTREIIAHLTSYQRRVEERANKNNV